MIKQISKLSINRKLLLVLLFSTLLSSLVAGLLLILLEFSEFQRSTKDQFTALAEVIGNRSSAALLFDDRTMAAENLAVFNNFPSVRSTCLYDSKNKIFVGLANNNSVEPTCPKSIGSEETRFHSKELIIVNTVTFDNQKLGIVYVRADLAPAYWQKIQFIGMLFLVLILISITTFLLSRPLLNLISLPINRLVNTVKNINSTGDYSLRAPQLSGDEIGILVESFNCLIDTVENQNKALIRAKNRYLTLYDDNPTMVFNVTHEGEILSANLTGAKQLGLSVEDLQNCSLFNFIHADDHPLMKDLIRQCFTNPIQVYHQEMRNICHNGRIIWVRATARLVENELHESSLLLVYEDITETRLLNEQIVYQADHDALTGLANRSKFDRYLKRSITIAHQENTEHALCYLDLDQFKIVNDTCGHLSGDELLRQLGELLRQHIRQYDFVARLGGDEFGILMYNCSANKAYQACEKLRDLIKDFNFAWEGRRFTVGVSIGISSINIASGNAVDLLKEADAACYAAKEKGRNRVHVYSPDDEELAMRQGEMQWVEKIRHGIDSGRFFLYGQTIVPLLHEEEGIHFEALLRYRDERGHIIPPGAFLPAAERYNLAPELDRWLIANLLEWLDKNPKFLDKLFLCSINLSGLSLTDEHMLPFITELFKRHSVPTQKICFEITETAAISNLSHATQFINQLKEQGCLFSLDDFGSGLSSFAYLKNLPVDFLKIDGLFVKDILDDQVDLAMVKSINEVGHVMNKKTIAEFVENEKILNLLRQIGIDYAQGYGIGRPVPLTDLLPNTTASVGKYHYVNQ
jgi:diguanylate cyclase (GGDEF)-like protein/PAS domain S-box-containing protein